MKHRKSLILRLKKSLPEFLSVKDLIALGIYRTHQSAYQSRIRGNCPPYLRIPGRGISYPREGLIEFLEEIFDDYEIESKCMIWNRSNSQFKVPPLQKKSKVIAT